MSREVGEGFRPLTGRYISNKNMLALLLGELVSVPLRGDIFQIKPLGK